MHQKYVNKFHGWNKWKKIIRCTKMFMPDNHLISFVFWRPQIISRYKMGWVFLFCNKRTLNHEQENCEERCTFPCFNYSVVLSTPVPIIDFVTWLYKLSWKMIIYKNLLSIFLESNFWKRNISLKHTFYWVFVFVFFVLQTLPYLFLLNLLSCFYM